MPKFIGFVPTPEEEIGAFFYLAPVSASDTVYDLGSGDGRLLFVALEKGAQRAVGIEIDPERVGTALKIAKAKGLEDRVTFIQGDVMEVSLKEATIVFCYLSSEASTALKPKLESELKYGTRVVMEWFGVPGWVPLKTLGRSPRAFYYYLIPPLKTD